VDRLPRGRRLVLRRRQLRTALPQGHGVAAVQLASPLCNSKGWASRLALGDYPCGPGSPDELCGIFAPARGSRLRDANKVYVRYCSSDAFMGDSSAFGMEFRGTRIVAAVLRDLASRRALGLAREGAEDTLLFGGGSAGARGALVHLDYVKSMLKIPDASNLVVKGFFDSPLWLDTEPFKGSSQQRAGRHHPAELSFPEQARRVFEYAKVGHLGRDCERRHRADSAWKCTFGQYRLPSVETPYLLVASQYDEFQLSAYVGHRPRGRQRTPSGSPTRRWPSCGSSYRPTACCSPGLVGATC